MKELLILIVALFVALAAAPFVMAKVKETGCGVAWNSAPPLLVGQNAALARAVHSTNLPMTGPAFMPGQITAMNASLFDQSNFSKELTDYACGFSDKTDLLELLQFIAPEVESPRKPEYSVFPNREAFLADGADDDLRAIGSDFKTVTESGEKAVGKLLNRGLAMDVDFDSVEDMSAGWENRIIEKLEKRLQRNSLIRAVAALSAAGVNTNKTWSTSAGKNPDGDVKSELVLAANAGSRGNRILYGDTARSIRDLSHEAQTSAGGFAAASRTEESLAGYLGVEKVMTAHARYASSSGASSLTEIVGNKVLMFAAYDDADLDDPSNIKRLVGNVSSEAGGGKRGVYITRFSDKQVRIAVEHYELLIVPHTYGIRQFTVSNT